MSCLRKAELCLASRTAQSWTWSRYHIDFIYLQIKLDSTIPQTICRINAFTITEQGQPPSAHFTLQFGILALKRIVGPSPKTHLRRDQVSHMWSMNLVPISNHINFQTPWKKHRSRHMLSGKSKSSQIHASKAGFYSGQYEALLELQWHM